MQDLFINRTIEALMIRIGFCGTLYQNYNHKPSGIHLVKYLGFWIHHGLPEAGLIRLDTLS